MVEHVLGYHLPDYWLVDVVRAVTVVLGVWLAAFALYRWREACDELGYLRCLFFFLFGILSATHEWEQFHRPFIVAWLPLFFLCDIVGLLIIRVKQPISLRNCDHEEHHGASRR